MLLVHLSALLLCFGGVVGAELRIKTVDKFIEFSNNVNKGTSYSGKTVFLESDIDFTGESFEPIGNSYSKQFNGTFDGQGHAIRNLKIISSSSRYVGLFGYSRGFTIRNVILDSSCSVTSSYESEYSDAFVGGIIGYCWVDNGPCTIENSVNMGNVDFSGTLIGGYLYLGGIAGYLSSSIHDFTVKNCANHGEITHSGTSSSSCIGGIVGYSGGSMHKRVYIYNSLNHGTITHNGTTSDDLHIGGIAGWSQYTTIENCVSSGMIPEPDKPAEMSSIGGIVGVTNSDDYSHCYFTKETGIHIPYESGTPGNTSNTPNTSITMDSALATTLNNQSTANGWNRWLANPGNAVVSFSVNYRTLLAVQEQVVLLPDPACNGERAFSGWHRDELLREVFDSSEVHSDTEAYGMFCGEANFSVALDVNGGNASSLPAPHPMCVVCSGVYGKLPIPTRTGYEFSGWYTKDGERVEAGDIVATFTNHSLYAHWAINNYTLTFDFDNGDEPDVRVLEYNQEIPYPKRPKKENCTFIGWNSTLKYMPAYDLTITAQWEEFSERERYFFSIAIWIIIIISTLVIIAITLVMFVHFRRKLKRKLNEKNADLDKPLVRKDRFPDDEQYTRFDAVYDEEIERSSASKPIQSVMTHLYTDDYRAPTMKEALLQAGLGDSYANLICNACGNVSRNTRKGGLLSEGFSDEDAAAVAMYTYDFGPTDFECNPYRIINSSLVERNYSGLQKASGLLYLMMTALRKLPRVTGETLYRGVKGEVNLDKDHYHKGNVVTWVALSSTSPDMDATKAFLAKGSKRDKAKGTLFIIEGGWGYDIQPYSLFPDEEEILLEPERQFKVRSVIEAEGLTFINLQMLDTPLSLPDVFGEGAE